MAPRKVELLRKGMHIFVGTIFLLLIYLDLFYLEVFIPLLFAGILLSIVCRYVRVPGIHQVLACVERKEETRCWPGYGIITFFLGSIGSVILFESDVAFVAVAVLTFGDSLARIVGENFGRFKTPLNKDKNVEGHIVAIAVCTILGVLILDWYVVIPGIIAGMVWELIHVKPGGNFIQDIIGLLLDDNITVPLMTGCVISLSTLLVERLL